MMYDRIQTKEQNIEAFRYGFFGNTLEVWDTVDEFLASGADTATVRYKDPRGGGSFCVYLVPPDKIYDVVEDLYKRGAKDEFLWYHDNPPGDGQTIQFEYQHRDATGWITEPVMKYTYINKTMRPAMEEECFHIRGHHKCRTLIRKYMTDKSYSAFEDTVNRWPDHVLEVSCFSTMVGAVPGHNALIWEVRDY